MIYSNNIIHLWQSKPLVHLPESEAENKQTRKSGVLEGKNNVSQQFIWQSIESIDLTLF